MLLSHQRQIWWNAVYTWTDWKISRLIFLFRIRWLYKPYNFIFFKVAAFTLNTFLQRFMNDSNTWNRLFCDIPFSAAAVPFSTSSSEENIFPRSCAFSVGNAQKSHGAKIPELLRRYGRTDIQMTRKQCHLSLLTLIPLNGSSFW